MNLDRSVPSILCFDTLKIWQIKKPEHLTSIEVKRSGFEVAFQWLFTKLEFSIRISVDFSKLENPRTNTSPQKTSLAPRTCEN